MGRLLTEEEIERGRRISRWLQYFHARHGSPQRQAFADLLGCPPQTVGQWLDYEARGGSKGRPSLDTIFLMRERLGAVLDIVVARDPTKDERALAGQPHHSAATDQPRVGGRRKQTARG
jgi:hypothetical protein